MQEVLSNLRFYKPLHEAIMDGDIDRVKQSMSSLAKQPRPPGSTMTICSDHMALALAVDFGSPAVADAILEMIRERSGPHRRVIPAALLFRAIKMGRQVMALLLLLKGRVDIRGEREEK